MEESIRDPEDQQPILLPREPVETDRDSFHHRESFSGDLDIVVENERDSGGESGSKGSSASQGGYEIRASDSDRNIDAGDVDEEKSATGFWVSRILRWSLVVVVLFMYALFPMVQHWAFNVVSVTLDYRDEPGYTTQADFFTEHENWKYRSGLKRMKFTRLLEDVDENDGKNDSKKKHVWGEVLKPHEKSPVPDISWDGTTRRWKGWLRGPSIAKESYLFGIVVKGNIRGGYLKSGGSTSEIKDGDDLGTGLAERTSGVLLLSLERNYEEFEISIDLTDDNTEIAFFYVPQGQPMNIQDGDKLVPRAQPVALANFVTGQIDAIQQEKDPTSIKMENANGKCESFVFTTIIVTFKTIIVFATLLLICILGLKNGNLKEEIIKCVHPMNIWRAAPIALMQTLADEGRFLAAGGMDPVTYLVLGKSEIILTPIVSTIVFHRRYTMLQWQLVIILTFAILAFSADSVFRSDPESVIFVVMVFMKVCFSVAGNILSERRFRKSDLSFLTILVNINILSVPLSLFFVLVVGWMKSEFSVFVYGFFGGKEFGWDQRTIIIAVGAALVQCLCLLVVKLYSAVVKTFISSSVPAFAYLLQLAMGNKVFDVSKLCLVFTIGMILATWSLSRGYVKEVQKEVISAFTPRKSRYSGPSKWTETQQSAS